MNDKEKIDKCKSKIANYYNISTEEAAWFVGANKLENHAYDFQDQEIKVLFKDKRCLDISEASDQLDRHFLEKAVTKYYFCFPKEIGTDWL